MATPFLGSSSELTRQQLRAGRYRQLSRDLYVLETDPEAPLPLHVRVEAVLLALPGAVPCLQTAAALLHLPVDAGELIHVARSRTAARSERAGVRVHRFAVPERERVEVNDLIVTAAPRTFVDLAGRLPLEELVAVGDAVLRRSGPGPLEQALTCAAGRPGVRAARAAFALADPGAGSAAETRTRLRLHRAGFTALRHGVVVRDRGGGWLAEPDLADEAARVAVQYDGAPHFEGRRRQRRQDVMRDELVREQDWQVTVVTALEDAQPHLLVARVQDAYRRAALVHGRGVLPAHLR